MLLSLELKSLEQRKHQNKEDLEEAGNGMDFRRELFLGELKGKRHVSPFWTGSDFAYYSLQTKVYTPLAKVFYVVIWLF